MSSSSKASTSKVRKFKHDFTPVGSGPKVPNEIQTSLLQVGMRVRKSVGTGYKAYSEYDKARMSTVNEDSTLNGARKCFEPMYGLREDARQPKSEPVPPFVGIHDDFPSSQESSSTVGSAMEPTQSDSRKRALGFEDDDEGASPMRRDESHAEDDSMDAVVTSHLRPIAQPRVRRPLNHPVRPLLSHKDDEVDFGEADFLQSAALDRTSTEDDGL